MKSEYILKARHDAHAEGPVSSATITTACQEILTTRGQNCNPSCAETSAESWGTTDNNSRFRSNEVGLIDNQVPMATDELDIPDLSEIEEDLNDNRQGPMRLPRNEQDLKKNVRDLLQDVLDGCLQSEKHLETPCDHSLDPPENKNGLTQSRNPGSETKQSVSEARTTFRGLTFFHPAAFSEHLGTAATQGDHPEPDPQCSTGAQTSGTKTGEEEDYEDIHNSRFISGLLRHNSSLKTTETEEELDAQIARALAKMDLRYNQFMTENVKRGSGGSDDAGNDC